MYMYMVTAVDSLLQSTCTISTIRKPRTKKNQKNTVESWKEMGRAVEPGDRQLLFAELADVP